MQFSYRVLFHLVLMWLLAAALLAAQTGPPSSNELTFVYDSSWGDEAGQASAILDACYQEARLLYGPPFFTKTISVKKNPNLPGGIGGTYGADVITAKSASAPQLCHEMLHAFRLPRGPGMTTAWEEGMVTAAMTEIVSRTGDFYDSYLHSPASAYHDNHNAAALAGFAGGGGLSLLNLRYRVAGYAWTKIFLEHDDFFLRFNRALYDYTEPDPYMERDPAVMMNMVAAISPTVEGQALDTWYDQHYIFATDRPVRREIFVANTSTAYTPATVRAYYFRRVNSGDEEMYFNSPLHWITYDSSGQQVDEGTANTTPQGAADALQRPIEGSLEIALPAGTGAYNVVVDDLAGTGSTSYWPNDAGATPFQGVFGVVAGTASGSVTLTPVGHPGSPVTVNVSKGYFSAPTLQAADETPASLAAARGQFTAVFSAPGGISVSKTFTKNAGPYFLLLSTLPNLRPEFAVKVPTVVAPGAHLPASIWVRNDSDVAAPASSAHFYFSSDTRKDVPDLEFTDIFPTFPAPAHTRVPSNGYAVTVPANIPMGSYYLIACVDVENALTELDEADNCVASVYPVDIHTDLSDLDPIRVDLSPTTQDNSPTSTVHVEYWVVNHGPTAAPASTTVFRLTSTTTAKSITLPQAYVVPSFDPYEQKVLPVDISLAGVPPGSYWVQPMVDATEQINEGDEANNSVSGGPLVVVQDAPPTIHLPGPIVIEATGADGATLPVIIPTATDVFGASVPVACDAIPPKLAVGASLAVACHATDTRGRTSHAALQYTVRDTIPPLLTVPAAMSVQAVVSAGIEVSYATSAQDLADLAPAMTCAPASGSLFPVGTTTVSCQAADASGNTSHAAFDVVVKQPVLTVPDAGITIVPASVLAPGVTTATFIDPAIAGNVPGGLALLATAYEIHSTAVITGPLTIAFVLPGAISVEEFASLRVLHGQAGALVDVTANSPPRDFNTRTIYAISNTLSPFYFAGAGSHVLPLFDQGKAYKGGSTIPIKLQLLNAANLNLSSPDLPLLARGLALLSTQTELPMVSSGEANPDGNFRFDSSIGGSGGYVFNLSTKGLGTGRYALSFYIGGDGRFIQALTFDVR